MHVALDWVYRGRRVQKGSVVYCAFEGAKGYEARSEAFRIRYLAQDCGPIEHYLVDARANLAVDHAELIADIRAQSTSPAVVVLDTLNRSMAGSENDDKDMGAYVRAADAIREAFDCVVIIVHHCGIEGSRPRGHTSLTGAADAQLAVKRLASGAFTVTVEWMKDGPEGDTLASRLEIVEVGTDVDGDPITSCVVIPEEAPTAVLPTRKLSDRHKLALDALAEAVLAHGTPADPAMQLGSIRVAPIAAWRDEMFSRGILDRGAPNPRTDFRRIKEGLHARGLIGVTGELVWLAT
jgi:hypothetical protein